MPREKNQIAVMIGKRMRQLRQEKGMKAVVLSNKLDIATSQLYGMENGLNMPRINMLANVCTCLRVKLSEFFEPIE